MMANYAWHAGGQRFESAWLHFKNKPVTDRFFGGTKGRLFNAKTAKYHS